MTTTRTSTEMILDTLVKELDSKAVANLGRYRATYAAVRQDEFISLSAKPFLNSPDFIMSNKRIRLRLYALFALTLAYYIFIEMTGGARNIWQKYEDDPIPRNLILSLSVINNLSMALLGAFLVIIFPCDFDAMFNVNQFRNRLSKSAKADFKKESKFFLDERVKLMRQLPTLSIFSNEAKDNTNSLEILRLLVDCYSMLDENDPELRDITKMIDNDFIFCINSFYERYTKPKKAYEELQSEYNEQRVAKRMDVW